MSVLSRFAFAGVPAIVSVSRATVAIVALACGGVSFCPLSWAAESGNDEQFMLELVNRMRMNPQGELDLLVNINRGPPTTFANPSSADPATRNVSEGSNRMARSEKMSHSLFEKFSDAASKKDASHERRPLRH